MQYKEVRKPLPEIARELDVDALIEGTVLRSGNQIRITVQLLQADPERHLWTDDYVRDLQDIIQMQKEVTRSIAQEINVTITQAEQERLTNVQTLNSEAHEVYLKGRYYWHQRTEEGILKATEFFQQAIEIDPEYALAYSGLADCYQVVPAYHMFLPTEVYPKARAAATRALELDDNLAEAYTSLGAVKHNLDWAFSDAEDFYKKAISLNPNYATAHQWYSELLMALGRHDEALMEIERAHELDPFSPIITLLRGDVYLYARQYDLAIERYQEALDLHPNFRSTYLGISTTYSLKEMHEEAIRLAQKAVNLTDNPVPIINLGYIYARSGQKDKALEQLWIMQNLPDQELLKYAERLAILYCGLGDIEKVFYWLEKAYEQHDVLISFIKVEPKYDPVRSDPRFVDLLKKLGLEK
jgi:tetratricopeptide (TPR) repeat protein